MNATPNIQHETSESPDNKAFIMDLRDGGEKRNDFIGHPSMIRPSESTEFKNGVIAAIKEIAEKFESREPGKEILIGKVDGLPTTGEGGDNHEARIYKNWFNVSDNLSYSKELLDKGIVILEESEASNKPFNKSTIGILAKNQRETIEFIQKEHGEVVNLPPDVKVYIVRKKSEDHYSNAEVIEAMRTGETKRSPYSHSDLELYMRKADLTPEQLLYFNKILQAGKFRRLYDGVISTGKDISDIIHGAY